jgi:hypothetical protein
MRLEVARRVFDWLRTADEGLIRRIIGQMTDK